MLERRRSLIFFACSLLGCTYPFGEVGIDGTGGNGATGATNPSGGGGAGGGTGASAADGGGGSASTGIGGAADCTTGGSGVCVDVAPGGWTGPVVYFDDDSASCAAPVFAGGKPDTAGVFGSALQFGPAQCTCGCDGSAGVACDPVLVGPNCDAGFSVPAGGCGVQAFLSPVTQLTVSEDGSPHCVPSVTVATSEPIFVQPRDVCEIVTTSDDCDIGTVCVQANLADDLCVWKTGDDTCPAGPYERKITIVESFDDQRGCDAAACTCQSIGSCQGVVTLYEDNDAAPCQIQAGLTAPTDLECIMGVDITIGSARYTLDSPITCNPSAGQPVGSVVVNSTTHVRTLCCLR